MKPPTITEQIQTLTRIIDELEPERARIRSAVTPVTPFDTEIQAVEKRLAGLRAARDTLVAIHDVKKTNAILNHCLGIY